MKVYHIVGSLDKNAGGPSRSVPQTCIELSLLGISIEIIARPSADPVSVVENENLKVRFLSFRELIHWGKKLKKSDADLIHLQHIWDPYIHLAAKAARKQNIPYIVTPRGMLEPWIMSHNPWKKKLGMLFYQYNDLKKSELIHATCPMEKTNICALGFNDSIKIIPNGIDLTQIPVAKNSYGSKKIVFLSRIHPKKGIELLLDAWKQVNIDDWQLEIAGNGDQNYIHQLQQKIKDEKIAKVHFAGAQYGNAKWEFLKRADIVVLPTYSENFGIVVAEALAVGVPVITTTGTPWEELTTRQCGWWINLSVENLITTLNKALKTPTPKLDEMGKRGQQLIRERYDIKAIGQAVIEMYDEVLKNRK